MRVLGIETSCDETAASVVTDAGHVLSDVVHSQVDVHAPYGGIVPELASRDHLHNIRFVVGGALRKANVSLAAIDGIAVTCRPGLTGALMVGVETAKGLAWAAEKPIVGVDHLVGHLVAAHLEFDPEKPAPKPPLPFIGLIASGGHTALYRVDGLDADSIRELGATRDDAAGEAFDKVAKLLGLGYPGGPVVDRLASEGDARAITLSKPMPQHASLEFSFSGLKSNVARWVSEHGRPGDDRVLRDLCAAFQRRVVDTLVNKAMHAAERENVGAVVLGGGVAANRELRRRAAEKARDAGLALFVPPFRACTDNAAMIAFAGVQRFRRGANDAGRVEVSARTILPRVTRKGRGARLA
ncbi:MAG TPA: tRNA (adenosine(37)-N6)-threonylcarbamoyltransferase complex transferase subunit TsaD [Polyangiaceae bacterium]